MRKLFVVIACLLTFSAFAKGEVPEPYIKPSSEAMINKTKSTVLTRPGLCELEVANMSGREVYVDFFYVISGKEKIVKNMLVYPGYSAYVPLQQYNGFCDHDNRAVTLIRTIDLPPTYIFQGFGHIDQVLKVVATPFNELSIKDN